MKRAPDLKSLRIAVRVYTQRSSKLVKKMAAYERKPMQQASEWTLVFDIETLTDVTQQLRVGAYQVYRGDHQHEAGLFFDPVSLSAEERRLVEWYGCERRLRVLPVEEFIEQVFYGIGYELRASIVGFNLPFDLSRLAIDHDSARGNDYRGGFSFLLQREKPRIQVKHLSARSALKRFTAPRKQRDGRGMRRRGIKTPVRRGYFVDVKTLAAALTANSHSLKSLADHLETRHRKATTEEHGGPLTVAYLDYACTDVLVTWECFQVLRDRYKSYSLTGTPLHQIFSEASLGKAYLKAMGVRPWGEVQSDGPPELLGIIMSTYYGGRAEVHVRRQIVRILYCDFLSMYPTVCTLMGLWQFAISQGIDWVDDTDNVRDFLAGITVADLQHPKPWSKLPVLVQVQPDNDVLPVRARYDDSAWTIGLNHLTSDLPMWYTLADCIAAKILTGRAPHVVNALRFTPRPAQSDLKPVRIAGSAAFQINPERDDFYQRLIDLRSEVKDKLKQAERAGDEALVEQLDAQQLTLKIIANAASYGIFVELNVNELANPEEVTCYGPGENGFPVETRNVEKPGRYFHPLLATLITGAARLMLAIAERKTLEGGLDWAFCDTDSLALARPEGMEDGEFLARAERVTEGFAPLNPYAQKGPLFKIEDVNYRLDQGRPTKQHRPLYCLAVSAKRYVLFNLDPDGRPLIRKASGHGLGHLRPPYDERNPPKFVPAPAVALRHIGVEHWQHDLWYQIIVAALEGHPDQVDLSYHVALNQPAVSRYAATTPALLSWFKHYNADKPYRNQVKPFNFLLMFQPSKEAWAAQASVLDRGTQGLGGMPTAVAPYHEDPAQAATRCFDRRTGEPVPIGLLKTYCQALAQYHLHPEAKFANGNYLDNGVTRRRHVGASIVEHIGKEANRWEQQLYLGSDPEAQIEYGASPQAQETLMAELRDKSQRFGQRRLAKAADVSLGEVSAVLTGKSVPRRATLARLISAGHELQVEESRAAEDEREVLAEASRLLDVIGLRRLASLADIDSSYLAKVLKGKRQLSQGLLIKLRTAFASDSTSLPS